MSKASDAKKRLKPNRPTRSYKPGKKKMVLASEGGKKKLIHYGAKGYGHNYSASARRSFRARHGCDKKKSKLSASYWACKDLWTAGGSKKSPPKGRKRK